MHAPNIRALNYIKEILIDGKGKTYLNMTAGHLNIPFSKLDHTGIKKKVGSEPYFRANGTDKCCIFHLITLECTFKYTQKILQY